jgi:hypothetical protein
MAGKTTAEMRAAVALVETGMTAYEAAKRCKVDAQALRRSAGYQALLVAGRVNLGTPGRKAKNIALK